MTNEQLIEKISSAFSVAEVKMGTQYPHITVKAADLHDFMLKLKSENEYNFDYLVCLSGVDYPEYMQMVYHLESTKHKHFIVVKANTLNRTEPVIDTVADIWPTAEFHEREVFDLLGVKFNNHTDLRRLFLDENWGFPLRKDYKDDIHVVER
jgi:NADH:ubiquinone oxidoreductase subunit C